MPLRCSKMWFRILTLLLATAAVAQGNPGTCDHTPAGNVPAKENDIFAFTIDLKDGSKSYLPDQTYILLLETLRPYQRNRPFRRFMITVEDAYGRPNVDVGSLKIQDAKSRYSEKCSNTVENTDDADKTSIEIHWVSPKTTDEETDQKIRLRAMVAENDESWYVEPNLTIELEKNTKKALDAPPLPAKEKCNLCSEARYEVIFKGKWSRMSHPRLYPSKPDENGYSYMIGASHAYEYNLWHQGRKPSEGLKRLAEDGDISLIEREIISNMSANGGTRTLIRGKRRHHPYMFEPSHSLLRADMIHHLFSIAVSMRPSPDWFLGTSMFELCGEDEWLPWAEIPLFPWDAGTMDGISYESPKQKSQTEGNVERVAVGSFDPNSPFYQKNLNDLKPFALLEVNRLDVFPLIGVDCSADNGQPSEGQPTDEPQETEMVNEEEPQPQVSEVRMPEGACELGPWGEWSECIPLDGDCGMGLHTRVRQLPREMTETNYLELQAVEETCQHQSGSETEHCYVECA